MGTLSATAFRIVYLEHLQVLWRQDPEAFLDLIALASGGGDLTLVDNWGDEKYAPRRILAAALKQIATTRRDGERRPPRRQGVVPPSP